MMVTPFNRIATVLKPCTAILALAVMLQPAAGGPINSDAAFTPREGGGILRLQYTFEEADDNGPMQHINKSTVKAVFIYGLKSNLALFVKVPYVNRKVDRFNKRFGRSEEVHDGIGDITVMAKYRFYQKDIGPLNTVRAAVLGGLSVRSGDSDFSSDSYDPILGAVFSWRKGRAKFDVDLIYRFNTGGGNKGRDTLRYDLTYSHRVFPAVYSDEHTYEIDAVAEINGRYVTDGTDEVFVSPGIVWSREQVSFELSVQIPAIQNIAGGGPETDYRAVAGIRFRW